MLLTETVEVAVSKGKEYYESKGYISEKGKFNIKIHDLAKGSHIKVQYRCNNCGNVMSTEYRDYLKTPEDFCHPCSIKIKSSVKRRLPFETVESLFKSRNYTLVSTESDYKNIETKLKYLCHIDHHGLQTIRYGDLYMGKGCRQCGIDIRTGSTSSTWRGGITEIAKYLRAQLSPWILQQLQKTNYTCELTGKQGSLNVHHMYSFKNILQDTMHELNMDIRPNVGDYSEDELQVITINILKNNDLYAKPIVMLESVHQDFHAFCGGNHSETSMEQLEQFKATLIA